MGYKDQMKRDVQKWRDLTRKVFFDVVNGLPEDIRSAVMFDIDDEKLNDIATHKNEDLIRKTVEGIADMMKKRKELLEEFSKVAGGNEHLSELDLVWVLKYGVEMFEEAAQDAFSEERTRVFTRMVTAGFNNRVNRIIGSGLPQPQQNTQDHSEP